MNTGIFSTESVLLWTAFHGIIAVGAYWFIIRDSEEDSDPSCEDNGYGPGDNWESENL